MSIGTDESDRVSSGSPERPVEERVCDLVGLKISESVEWPIDGFSLDGPDLGDLVRTGADELEQIGDLGNGRTHSVYVKLPGDEGCGLRIWPGVSIHRNTWDVFFEGDGQDIV